MAGYVYSPRVGIPYPGFSDRVNDPEVLAALKKNRKAGAILSFFVVPLPLIGFVVYSKVTGDMEMKEAVTIGLIVSAVFLAFALFSFVKSKVEKPYEAVVVDQEERLVERIDDDNRRNTYTEYITVVQTTDGKKKKIKEQSTSQVWAYRYLEEGDRFRYHPEFAFPYELYDKARAPYIACVACSTQNPVEADRCKKCNVPLLK